MIAGCLSASFSRAMRSVPFLQIIIIKQQNAPPPPPPPQPIIIKKSVAASSPPPPPPVPTVTQVGNTFIRKVHRLGCCHADCDHSHLMLYEGSFRSAACASAYICSARNGAGHGAPSLLHCQLYVTLGRVRISHCLAACSCRPCVISTSHMA